MKKTFLTLAFIGMTIACNAQAPFTYYTPVYTDPYGRPVAPQQQTQKRENLQTINAYFINSRGAFQKIKIKVNVTADYYGNTQVYVRGYCDLTYGRWNNVNNQATAITQYSNEPDVIKENFDWKCYILNIGYVYF